MNGTPHMDSDRLARYLAGEASAEERTAVERWAAADPAHARELDAMRAAWELADAPAARVDVDAAWARMRTRMAGDVPERGRVMPIGRQNLWRWAAVAATIAGLVLATRLLMLPAGQEYVASATFVHAVLSDSSRAVLSPGTTVEARMGAERRVQLQGEAYFEVQRDTAHPFIVEADGFTVKVLGTGFTVTAYDTSRMCLVRVRHGHVRVQVDTALVDLLAGEEVLVDRAAKRLVRQEVPSNVVWGDRIVQFDGVPMGLVVARLHDVYQVNVTLKEPTIARCRLTATFDNEEIGDVLRVIAETFGLRLYDEGGGRYVLDGNGC